MAILAREDLWAAGRHPVSERTLTGLSVLLQSNALEQALQPYCLGGPFGQLLDAESERLGAADVQVFETEGLIGRGATAAVLSYLFHRIEGRTRVRSRTGRRRNRAQWARP